MFRVYNIEDGKQIQTWECPASDKDGYLIKIDLDASGRYLATSCSNKYIYLWDLKSHECIALLCGHDKDVNDLKFSPDGRRLYSIAGDRYHRFDCFDLFFFQLENFSCVFIWKLVKADSLSSSRRSISEARPNIEDRQT
jgi:WD40 repeat protein